jgi:hypothetical protein
MTEEHEDVDNQAVRDARAAELIRALLGKALDTTTGRPSTQSVPVPPPEDPD